MAKTITIPFIILALLFSGMFFMVPNTADAACSYNGFVNSNGKCGKSFKKYKSKNYRSYTRNSDLIDSRISFLRAYIERLMDMIELLEDLDDDNDRNDRDDDSDVEATTRSAVNVGEDTATLRGQVDFNNEDEATVYFQYGRSRSNLDSKTTEVELDENDDDEDFSRRLNNLRSDTLYYFRAVAEDDQGDRDFGSTLSFRTDENDSNNSGDEPDVSLKSITDVTDDSAELRGSVDMNDFNNGRVFFVYGEDEDQVEDIADDYDNYSEVDEDGDDLQKVTVDSDLDGTEDYTLAIGGLDSDTDIFYSLCVEYEDEDDEDVLKCSNTRDFITD